jgi:hypothetical protein
MTWWLWRGACTRSHPELGRENPQRPWYCVLRRGRVGRRQVFQPIRFPLDAGWSSPVARQAHNLKAAGSNPAPATTDSCLVFGARRTPVLGAFLRVAEESSTRAGPGFSAISPYSSARRPSCASASGINTIRSMRLRIACAASARIVGKSRGGSPQVAASPARPFRPSTPPCVSRVPPAGHAQRVIPCAPLDAGGRNMRPSLFATPSCGSGRKNGPAGGRTKRMPRNPRIMMATQPLL